MAALYEIKKGKTGQYSFVLKAANGEVILTSQSYKSKSGAKNGVASVQNNGSDEARYVRKEAKNKKPYFVLRAGNHQIIGTSEMYETTAMRDKGIASVKKNASATKIVDEDS